MEDTCRSLSTHGLLINIKNEVVNKIKKKQKKKKEESVNNENNFEEKLFSLLTLAHHHYFINFEEYIKNH